MIKKGIEIQPESALRIFFGANCILLARPVSEKKKKSYSLHFFKFIFVYCKKKSFNFSQYSSYTLAIIKNPLFADELRTK
jgi:hypothetical protein